MMAKPAVQHLPEMISRAATRCQPSMPTQADTLALPKHQHQFCMRQECHAWHRKPEVGFTVSLCDVVYKKCTMIRVVGENTVRKMSQNAEQDAQQS